MKNMIISVFVDSIFITKEIVIKLLVLRTCILFIHLLFRRRGLLLVQRAMCCTGKRKVQKQFLFCFFFFEVPPVVDFQLVWGGCFMWMVFRGSLSFKLWIMFCVWGLFFSSCEQRLQNFYQIFKMTQRLLRVIGWEGTGTTEFGTMDVWTKILSNKAGVKGFFAWMLTVLPKGVVLWIIFHSYLTVLLLLLLLLF